MEKHNQTLTEGIIDQVPEMEITWNFQSSKVLVKFSFMIKSVNVNGLTTKKHLIVSFINES